MTAGNQTYERRAALKDLGFQDYWINRIGLEDHPLREFAAAHPGLVDKIRYLMWSAWLGGAHWYRDHLQELEQSEQPRNWCAECGAILNGASYDHDPSCSEFPVTPGSPDYG